MQIAHFSGTETRHLIVRHTRLGFYAENQLGQCTGICTIFPRYTVAHVDPETEHTVQYCTVHMHVN